MCIIALCAYAIMNADFWAEGYNMVESWVFNNHWDTDISHKVLSLLGQINTHKNAVLSAFIARSCLAIFNAMLMILGVCLRGRGTRRYLLLPWLVFDFLTISVTFLTFVTWAFLSFFVHVLVAIIFPILAGAVLGLHIYLWRNVKDVYFLYAEEARALKKHVQSVHAAAAANRKGQLYTPLNPPPPRA